MCDRYERTRSWFRVVPLNGARTRLQFGSAVAAARDDQAGAMALGGTFRLLLGFHVLYSQVLLRAAKAAVTKAPVVGCRRRRSIDDSGNSHADEDVTQH